jgi:hypothetical protein
VPHQVKPQIRSLRVLLGPIQPSQQGIAGHLRWFTPRRSLPRRVLETIQGVGERFGIATGWRANSSIPTESLRAQGPGEDDMAEPTLYERLGGIFAIAAVVDHFSDQLLKNPKVVEANPELNEWHTGKYPGRLPGLKFLRTLWVASLAGGPFQWGAALLE